MKQVICLAAMLLMANVLLAQNQIELKRNYFKVIGVDTAFKATGQNNKALRAILSENIQAADFAKQSAQWGRVKYVGYGAIGAGLLAAIWNSEFGLLGTGGGIAAAVAGAVLQRKNLRFAVEAFNFTYPPDQSYQPYFELDATGDKPGMKLVYTF